MNITVAVSGGVDSLYALLSSQAAGHTVQALHARLTPVSQKDPVPQLEAVCRKAGIPFAVVDLKESFDRQVIQPFAAAYRRAQTPNPCAVCNRTIKFGKLLDAAKQTFGKNTLLATGHYVSLVEHAAYGLALKSGSDALKDQSYFLALTPLARLQSCLFPLAEQTKPAIRAWMAERGHAVPLPQESQEICFVPNDDYRSFLTARGVALPGPGPVLLQNPPTSSCHAESASLQVIGQHQGLWRYTEGQRKGLGIAWREPIFVLEKDRRRNALIVGPRSALDIERCTASQINCMVPPELWPDQLLVRTRYRQSPAPAHVTLEGNALHIEFAEPQCRPAPGQVAAVYDKAGFVLAGGILD